MMSIAGVLALVGWTMALNPEIAAAPEPEFIPPAWASAADPATLAALTPAFAGALGLGGVVTVRCMAPVDGPPTDCVIVSESPEGVGFGDAALRAMTTREIRAARLDGEISPRSVQTNVRFPSSDLDAVAEPWSGPEPTPQALTMARVLANAVIDNLPNRREAMLAGLAIDRREVVQSWIDELMPPDPEQDRAILSLQLARVFGETDLRRILAGEQIPLPDAETLQKACPEATAEQKAAAKELRRRYCEQYDCDAAA